MSAWIPRGWATAAMLALAVIAIGGLAVVGSSRWRASDAGAPHVRTFTTAVGERATVQLADGSQAILGPATTLSVTVHPSGASVDVRVVGQALFTVVHRDTRSFRVHAGNAVAQVLGTTFMVRRYDADRVARVIVTDGRVLLSRARGSAPTPSSRVLVASTLGTVDDSGQVQVTPNIAVEDYTSWTMGQLVFHKTPAREAVIELGRAYGADIRIADSALAAQPLSWTIPLAQRSLADVLESLADALGAHPVRHGHIVTLVAGRSAQRRPLSPPSTPQLESQYGR